jgi:hypothetical protein
MTATGTPDNAPINAQAETDAGLPPDGWLYYARDRELEDGGVYAHPTDKSHIYLLVKGQLTRVECDNRAEADAALNALPPQERQDVFAGRKRRAEEARIAAHYAAVIADLGMADAVKEAEFDKTARRLRSRAEPHGAGEDDVESLTYALMRSFGWRDRETRKGTVWEQR